MMRLLLAITLILITGLAAAQVVPQPGPPTPIACAYNTSPVTLTSGQAGWAQCSSTGSLLTSGTVSGTVAATQSGTWTVQPGNTPNTSPWLVTTIPSAASGAGITPVVSASAEATHVLKASGGNLYSVYATNLTATAGFLLILNSTSAPGDGAVTPLECVPLPGNGSASINYSGGPPAVFSTGITAVITSAATCFTKTTGVITGFIKGSVL